MQNNYDLLIRKLDQFIRKYYINKLIRGALYSVGLILLLFILVNVLEYYRNFDMVGRKVLFYSFVGISLAALGYWVVLPLLKYFHLGKVISHAQAATIIGDHFSGVQDKLLNILQLKQQSDSVSNKELILASIDQKSEEIKPVPFRSAINLSQNRKYLRYALPPLLLLIILLFAAPSMIRESTKRLINNSIEYLKPAPFQFVLEEEDPSVVQYGDYPLTVRVEGEQLPNEVFIDVDNYQYRLTKKENNLFSYRFSNVQKDVDFRLYSADVNSKKYTLTVLKKPNVIGFETKLNFPDYTGRKDETLQSVGDLVVPVGTTIDWVFNAENTDDIQIRFLRQGQVVPAKRFSDELFTYRKRAMEDDTYRLLISNEDLPNADSISYGLTIIPDLYPEITVERFQDTVDNKLLFFVGEASDDYGMKSLSFNYQLKKADGTTGKLNTTLLSQPNSRQIEYDHTFDMQELELKPGDEVSYYFEVFDNDAVNGSKSARTNMMVFAMPTVEEYEAMAEANDEQIKNNLQKALEESKKVQEELKKMREKLLQENELDWQNRKELEKLLERQKELEQQISEAQKAFQENLENQQEFETPSEEQIKKQEQMQKLFNEVMSDEMKELMQKLEELMQQMEKDDALQMMEEFELNNEEMEMEMDRLLELYKQMELDMEMQKAVDKLQELADEEEKLSEETEKLAQEQNEEKNDQQGDQQDNKDGEQNQEDKQQQGDQQNKEGEQNDQQNKEGEQNDQQNKEGEQNQEENKEGEQNDQQNKDGQQNEQQDQEGEQNEQQNQDGQQNQEQDQQENGQQDPQSKQEQLQQKQEEINKKFEQIQEQMDKIQEKNEQLENKRPMGDQQEQMEDIDRDLQESQQQLQQQQNNKASQSQKNASQKMRQMAQQMNQQMQAGQMQQMQEDMESLRQLLENLVGLSFDQEDLIDDFEETEVNTPRYVELVQEQFKLKDDFRLIEDSLQALSKRVMQIESFVTEKVTTIKNNIRKSLDDLEERRKFQAADHQQRTMKNVNDLALMLSEVMNQMQQQMSSMMAQSSQQMCKQPKSGQGQPQDKISQQQQQLNQQMMQNSRQMREEGQGMSAEEFAKMAARQAALRKALQEKQKKLSEQGKGSMQLQELINQMDKVETDLVNKRLRNETLQRQQEILNRLLEFERAEREQEFDDKRKSETAKTEERRMPPSLEEYIKKRKAELELYKTVSPSLKPYYRGLVEEYFKNLKDEGKGSDE